MISFGLKTPLISIPKMDLKAHEFDNIKIAELISNEILIKNKESGFQLMIDLYYQNFDAIILYEKNTSSFFNLKTGLAGEILQKFSNYKMKIVIIANFENYKSKSLNDFIFESNKSK